jgi:hypothetical protein
MWNWLKKNCLVSLVFVLITNALVYVWLYKNENYLIRR